MEVLDMFLKDMEISEEYKEDSDHSIVVLPSELYDIIINKIMKNSYYYNNSKILGYKCLIRLTNYEVGYWKCYKIEITNTPESTNIECTMYGYETILPDGKIIITDSLTSKLKLEM